MSIKIMNMRGGNWPIALDYHVRVDRNSILGNPYPMTNLEHRDKVCDQYALWFKNQLEHSSAFRAQLEELVEIYQRRGELYLYCWCAPLRCHAETIKAHLEECVKMHDHIVGVPC